MPSGFSNQKGIKSGKIKKQKKIYTVHAYMEIKPNTFQQPVSSKRNKTKGKINNFYKGTKVKHNDL